MTTEPMRFTCLAVEASGGEAGRLDPGDGLLLEDTTGLGHTSRVIGDEPARGMFVQVPGPV